MVPTNYTTQQKKNLVVKVADFMLIAVHLYKIGPDEILRRYVLEQERKCIIVEAHGELAGGHYAGKATVE